MLDISILCSCRCGSKSYEIWEEFLDDAWSIKCSQCGFETVSKRSYSEAAEEWSKQNDLG